MPGLLVAGTNSDAGKSTIVTGLCRALSRRGVSVAPFKAQNMSNNSMVCADGAEIGRAQYLQALAAGVEPSSLHNPVLLKPGTDRQSFVVLRGEPAGQLHAGQYATGRSHLARTAFAAFEELSSTVDLVLAEGAGSPAETNLRSGDYVNMGLARRFNLPVLVLGDIDRGGVLAALYGTWALLQPADRRLLRAYAINRFRGDPEILAPGLADISARTGLPCVGVVPWLAGVWLDSEDTLSVGTWRSEDAAHDTATLTVAVVRFPRTSNATDVDALAAEPGIQVQVTTDADLCRDADLLVLPGTRATVADLSWLRRSGLADIVIARAQAGRPVLGICGGYQMLCTKIHDEVESGAGSVAGLGVLPAVVEFGAAKVLGRPRAVWSGHDVAGYEIHHGVARATGGDPFPGGLMRERVAGTMWHGVLECDDFRRAWLTGIATATGSQWRPATGATGFAERRLAMLDILADAMEEHLNIDWLVDCARALP